VSTFDAMSERQSYHHGDLRAALLKAAAAEIERSGYETLSLRELAASLGVSRAAPYRHFADRRALLSVLAAQGFDELAEIHSSAAAKGGTPRQQLAAAGRGYLAFAAARPQLFRLMFVSDLLTGETRPDPVLIAAANRSYAIFEAMVAATLPGADDKTVKATAIAHSSASYGFALMRMEKRIKPFMLGGLSDAELVDALFTIDVRPGRRNDLGGKRRRTRRGSTRAVVGRAGS
jgi:AcrR family transcriptional regulator